MAKYADFSRRTLGLHKICNVPNGQPFLSCKLIVLTLHESSKMLIYLIHLFTQYRIVFASSSQPQKAFI